MKLPHLLHRSSLYHSLNTIEIDSQALLENLQILQHIKPEHTIIPVLKSNAYGHGLKQVCQILSTTDNTTTPLLAVDSYPEYQIVRDYTRKSVLVLGETLPENYHLYNPRRTHLAVGSLPVLQSLIKTGKRRNIHLFLNTGMNREGFQKRELGQALEVLKHAPQHIHIVGVMSHFANADDVDTTTNLQQINQFTSMLKLIHSYGHKPLYTHISNSAGISKVHDDLFTASRSGLALYGYNPLNINDPHYDDYQELRPALAITTTITALQYLKTGDRVSYGEVWTAKKPTTIATLPFGYREGLPRGSDNGCVVSSTHHDYPIVGRVCMNLSSIDLGNNPENLKIGDQITLISADLTTPNTINALATINDMIPYGVLAGLDSGLRRVIDLR